MNNCITITAHGLAHFRYNMLSADSNVRWRKKKVPCIQTVSVSQMNNVLFDKRRNRCCFRCYFGKYREILGKDEIGLTLILYGTVKCLLSLRRHTRHLNGGIRGTLARAHTFKITTRMRTLRESERATERETSWDSSQRMEHCKM